MVTSSPFLWSWSAASTMPRGMSSLSSSSPASQRHTHGRAHVRRGAPRPSTTRHQSAWLVRICQARPVPAGVGWRATADCLTACGGRLTVLDDEGPRRVIVVVGDVLRVVDHVQEGHHHVLAARVWARVVREAHTGGWMVPRTRRVPGPQSKERWRTVATAHMNSSCGKSTRERASARTQTKTPLRLCGADRRRRRAASSFSPPGWQNGAAP
jgi:hypothetical protein